MSKPAFNLKYTNGEKRLCEINDAIDKYSENPDICKILNVIKLYLQCRPYREISVKTGVTLTTVKEYINRYRCGGADAVLNHRIVLSGETKKRISLLHKSGLSNSEIAKRMNVSIWTVEKYKDYCLNEAENKTRGENNITIEEIEKKIAEQENVLQELKKELEKVKENENKIPDDVKDISLTFSNDMYVHDDRYNDIIGYLICGDKITHLHKNGIEAQTDEICIKRRFFPTDEMAKEFYDKTQLIADCLYFKYLYDRDYVPDWNDEEQEKYYVLFNFDTEIKGYSYNYRTYLCDYSCVYFSSQKIAKKCADWLNYIYKKGKYAE